MLPPTRPSHPLITQSWASPGRDRHRTARTISVLTVSCSPGSPGPLVSAATGRSCRGRRGRTTRPSHSVDPARWSVAGESAASTGARYSISATPFRSDSTLTSASSRIAHWAALLTWPRTSRSTARTAHGRLSASAGQTRQGESGRHPAPTSGGTVDPMELVAERADPAGHHIDLHPQTHRLDTSTPVGADRRAAFSPAPPRTRTERRQAELLAEYRHLADGDERAPHDPADGVGESAVDGVLVGDILKMTGQAIEPQSALLIDVAQPHRGGGGEASARGGHRHELGSGGDGTHRGAQLSSGGARPSRRAAFHFRMRGRTSGRMSSRSKSASQRSGVITG